MFRKSKAVSKLSLVTDRVKELESSKAYFIKRREDTERDMVKLIDELANSKDDAVNAILARLVKNHNESIKTYTEWITETDRLIRSLVQ